MKKALTSVVLTIAIFSFVGVATAKIVGKITGISVTVSDSNQGGKEITTNCKNKNDCKIKTKLKIGKEVTVKDKDGIVIIRRALKGD